MPAAIRSLPVSIMDGIIWHSDDLKIFLLDIPGSITAAQGTKARPATAHLLSNKARDQPYHPIVPQNPTTKQRLDSNASKKIEELHELYMPDITAALDQIKEAIDGRAWCEPRRCGAGYFEVQAYKKHKRKYALYDKFNFEVCEIEVDSDIDTTDEPETLKIPKDLLKSLVSLDPFTQQVRRQEREIIDTQAVFKETKFNALFHNSEDHTVTLTLKPDIKMDASAAAHQEDDSSHGKDNANVCAAALQEDSSTHGQDNTDASAATSRKSCSSNDMDNGDASSAAVPQESLSHDQEDADASAAVQVNSSHAKDNTDASTAAVPQDASSHGQDNADAMSVVLQEDPSQGKDNAGASAAALQDGPSHCKVNTPTALGNSAHNFRIPPGSTFVLADCLHGQTFRAAVRNMHQQHDTPKRFDLIMMDPPWSNSSAQASGSYQTHNGNAETLRMFQLMDLDAYIAPGGFVCVWVTNSERARDAVLGPNGLFAMMAVSLVEEWIWIKTTARGQPQSTIDSKWRKPYEVLLIGQAPFQQGSYFPPTGAWPVNRRVLAAVPDLHSRKPCLKPVLERVWGRGEGEYAALEIFARTCVAGWWSWGNEVIKYNWEKYWVDGEEEREQVEKRKKSAQDFSQLYLGEDGEEEKGKKKKKKTTTEKNGEENKEAEEKAATEAVVGEKRKASSLEE